MELGIAKAKEQQLISEGASIKEMKEAYDARVQKAEAAHQVRPTSHVVPTLSSLDAADTSAGCPILADPGAVCIGSAQRCEGGDGLAGHRQGLLRSSG